MKFTRDCNEEIKQLICCKNTKRRTNSNASVVSNKNILLHEIRMSYAVESVRATKVYRMYVYARVHYIKKSDKLPIFMWGHAAHQKLSPETVTVPGGSLAKVSTYVAKGLSPETVWLSPGTVAQPESIFSWILIFGEIFWRKMDKIARIKEDIIIIRP